MPSEDSAFEIRLDGCEMILSPTALAMNEPVSVRAMTDSVDRLLNEPRPNLITDLIVDFAQIERITSVGLNELIQLKQRVGRSGVGVKLRSVTEDVRQVFQITRLERIFDLVEVSPTESSALSASDSKRDS
ncbi:MAG: STAS domain-containing protein [Planctomycetota bacterium]